VSSAVGSSGPLFLNLHPGLGDPFAFGPQFVAELAERRFGDLAGILQRRFIVVRSLILAHVGLEQEQVGIQLVIAIRILLAQEIVVVRGVAPLPAKEIGVAQGHQTVVGQRAFCRADKMNTAALENPHIFLRRGVVPHGVVHGRRDDDGAVIDAHHLLGLTKPHAAMAGGAGHDSRRLFPCFV